MKRIITSLILLLCLSSISAQDIALEKITRNGNHYYYEGWEMKGYEYANFLADNCISAYQSYLSGWRIYIAGWCFFGVGLTGMILGIATLSPIACIPTLCVAYKRMHASVNIYNERCYNHKPDRYWSFNINSNKLSIAYNF